MFASVASFGGAGGQSNLIDSELSSSHNVAQARSTIHRLKSTYGAVWNEFDFGYQTSNKHRLQRERTVRRSELIEIEDSEYTWAAGDAGLEKSQGSNGSETSNPDKSSTESAGMTPGEELQAAFACLREVDLAFLDNLETKLRAIRPPKEDAVAKLAALGRKERMWRLLTDKDSSRAALGIALLMIAVIMISTIAICLESLPELMHNNHAADVTFFAVDTFCVTIFTIEYCLRVWSCPMTPLKFALAPMNLIDLISILPYYVSVASGLDVGWLTILRALRMVRILRFAEKNASVACVKKTLIASVDIMYFMLFLLVIVVIVFAAFVYNLERGTLDSEKGCYVKTGENDCSKFVSIPEAMWWCIGTLMFVGYGDIVPTTIPGKFFASVCCVMGILVVALPVSVLGANFNITMMIHREEAKRSARKIKQRARRRGSKGVLKSSAKVVKAVRAYQGAIQRCHDKGAHALEQCTQAHEQLWRAYLTMPTCEDTDTPMSTRGDRSWEEPTCCLGLIRSKLRSKHREMEVQLPRPGEKQLFAVLSQDFQEVYEDRLHESLSRAKDLCDVHVAVTPAMRYIQFLAKAADVPLLPRHV
eukprot:TRINITY_DN3454_c0_g1_i3.p1 TRINITY_DN3454_c0_g1~~TRINITY_DN3454_c0_g1_i3.p1  ORF type:complete len:590 (+),score=141.83 TRINITY_DN3454_c0_g1_i3:139-1908(+)